MSGTRRVAVITGSRADYGLLRPTLDALDGDERFEPRLIVTAMHLSPKFGDTVKEVEADGREIAARVETEDAPNRMSAALEGMARAFEELDPDIVLLLGDRYEMLAAALAAAAAGVPIAHLHGGELSEGSLDDAMRHSITKLALLHFVAAREYGERVVQLGEEPDRVHVVGATGLETIRRLEPLSRDELAGALEVQELAAPLATVTFHPASLQPERAAEQADALVGALEKEFAEGTVIVTLPNDDPGNEDVRARLQDLAGRKDNVHAFDNLGQHRYLSLLNESDLVIGNSSSALIEAPAFQLPVVNVGDRQRGRLMLANVISCDAEVTDIAEAIEKALYPAFRKGLNGLANPYGDGNVSARVLDVLAETDLSRPKQFFDLEGNWREGLRFGTMPS